MADNSSVDTKSTVKGPDFQCTLQHPWERVIRAYDNRFPNHPAFPTVLDGKTVQEEQVSPFLSTKKRIITLDVGYPHWVKKLTGLDTFTVEEDCVTDFQEKVMTIRTENVSFSNRMRLFEECVYRTHPENGDWTLKEQRSYIKILFCNNQLCEGLKKRIEDFCRSSYEITGINAAEQEKKLLAKGEL
eukprot:TRINITY_DN3530_c0_g1_i1.p1 TRINITY_DN3530_c0_g1~~TRINITY_DN3530_c0_g1_i1.p1  ORF type:complete len:187 (-),score=22.33 TRINITY_DN3530_c0_g1_i1:69-629(-)